MPRATAWTPAEDALAQLLTEQGRDSAEIAAMGVSGQCRCIG